MNTPNKIKESSNCHPCESRDPIKGIKPRSQTVKIASAFGGVILALLPATVKAEALGIKLDSDFENLAGDLAIVPELSPGATKDRWKMTFQGYIDEMTGIIHGKEFRVKNNKNDGVVIEILSKSVMESNCFSEKPGDAVSCFYIMNADGTVQHTASLDPGIFVDGQQKWSDCGDSGSFMTIHPSKNKEEIKLVKPYGKTGVFRVPVASTNYCVDKVKDINESIGGMWEAPETQDLVSLAVYKPKPIDAVKVRFKARDSSGNLIGLNRNSDGTWIAVTPAQDQDDFSEEMGWLEIPLSMLERETPDGRKVTIIMTVAETTRIYVLEKHPDWTPENPKWKEVPATVEAVYETDPYFVLDDDGDGVPNSVEEATGGCIGYTDADKVDVNGDGKSDTCQIECETYANEYGETLTPSDLLPCTSDLGYESAGQLKDGSTLHYTGFAPILGADGKIIAQSSSKLRYIHATLVGAVDAPELARDIALPDGYGAEIKVNSGTAHVTGFDFLGTPVEVTVTPESGLVDLGFIYGAETGIEGSDVEFTVGSEYQPCQNIACQSQNPEPPAAEPATAETPQTAETPTQVETATQTEPPAQVELPTPQPEPVLIAETPMPVAEPITESASDVVESSPETFVIPSADVTSSPEVVVYTDTPGQNTDTKQSEDVIPTGTETSPDTQPSPDMPPSEDTADAGGGQDLQTAGQDQDAPPAKTDNAPGTDVSVQSEDTQLGTPDTLQSADTHQQNQPDTASQPDKPKDEGGSGGGCNCAIENPDDPSALAYLAGLGSVALAWASARRRRLKEVLGRA